MEATDESALLDALRNSDRPASIDDHDAYSHLSPEPASDDSPSCVTSEDSDIRPTPSDDNETATWSEEQDSDFSDGNSSYYSEEPQHRLNSAVSRPVEDYGTPSQARSLVQKDEGHPLSAFLHLTISDDLSQAEKREERSLLALRDRAQSPQAAETFYKPTWVSQNPNLDWLNFQSLLMAEEQDMIVTDSHRVQDAGLTVSEMSIDRLSMLTTSDLQKYVDQLQNEIKSRGVPSTGHPTSRHQILYRIRSQVRVTAKHGSELQSQLSSPYFDPPKIIMGQSEFISLRCEVSLENLDLFLEKNKDIAFLVYYTYEQPMVQSKGSSSNHNSFTPVVNESIWPVNRHLRDAIEAILRCREEYADLLHQHLIRSELKAPYLFMYFHRDSAAQVRKSLDEAHTQQLHVFEQFLGDKYGNVYRIADEHFATNTVRAGLIRYLFKPGDVLIRRESNEYQGLIASGWPLKQHSEQLSRSKATKILKDNFSGKCLSRLSAIFAGKDTIILQHWKIDAWHWDFDGEFYRKPRPIYFSMPVDEQVINESQANSQRGKTSKASHLQDTEHVDAGTLLAIDDLKVFPIAHAPSDIVAKLRDRGRMFWKCRQRRFVSYIENESEQIQVSVHQMQERYMIDTKTYRALHKHNQYERPGSRGITSDYLESSVMSEEEPPDERFELVLPSSIKGYSMRRKKWFDLSVDRISDVKWNKEAFDKVVIDRKGKDLIRALISNQISTDVATDLIAGKGNGLILLLHGSPGTGKTLTAESVAEIAEKPLYRVTCGDVGTRAEDVEKYLESVLHLGKLWDCVVLVDEADVFLEQRGLEDLQRNALVSVFLRMLEYYEGILVLTSNRVGTFDEAFKSRIQLALHFPALGPYQRLRIWENFIDRLDSFPGDTIDVLDLRDHLEQLKEEKMNGRQIRNAITTAREYAQWKKQRMSYDHLKDVIGVSKRFDDYINKLHGGFSEDELAEDGGLRLA